MSAQGFERAPHPAAYQRSKRTTTETDAVNRAKGCSRALRLQNRRVQTVHFPIPGAYWPHGRQHQPASSPPTTPDAAHAVAIVGTFRQHPTWRLIDYPGDTASMMDEVWRRAGQPNVGRRVVFNARLALTLCHHGVTEFAMRNEGHFAGFGFTRVWNPLATLRT
jgi:hypothetical protein